MIPEDGVYPQEKPQATSFPCGLREFATAVSLSRVEEQD